MPTSFSTTTPGYSLSTRKNGTNVGTTLTRLGSAAQTAFDERFGRSLSDLDTLRGGLTPGFSDLRASALQQVENARSSTVGNIRESFARRGLAGSSFTADAQARAEKEFAQQKAQVASQSFLQELDANLQVLQQEGAAIESALQRDLAEFQIASGANVQLSDLISRNTQFEQQLKAQEAAAEGQFWGSLLGTVGTVGGAVLGGIYGGPAGASLGGTAGGALGGSLGGAIDGGGSSSSSSSGGGFGSLFGGLGGSSSSSGSNPFAKPTYSGFIGAG